MDSDRPLVGCELHLSALDSRRQEFDLGFVSTWQEFHQIKNSQFNELNLSFRSTHTRIPQEAWSLQEEFCRNPAGISPGRARKQADTLQCSMDIVRSQRSLKEPSGKIYGNGPYRVSLSLAKVWTGRILEIYPKSIDWDAGKGCLVTAGPLALVSQWSYWTLSNTLSPQKLYKTAKNFEIFDSRISNRKFMGSNLAIDIVIPSWPVHRNQSAR